MKQFPFIILSFAFSLNLSAQSLYDTIYSNNERIACTVKEITPEAVRYSYPGEELVNAVFKNTIQKIVFKSGRVQVFAEATSLRTVNSADDFDYVSLSHVSSEVKGLYKMGDVGAKARGTTIYANMEKVKERSIRKMKIQAAMMGANVIYLTQEATSNNFYGSATSTNMAGVAYSSILPSFNGFMNLMNNTMKFKFIEYEVDKLSTDDYDLVKYTDSSQVIMNRIYNDDGFIMMNAHINGFDNTTFKVVYYTNDCFILECTDNSDIFENTIYNIRVKL